MGLWVAARTAFHTQYLENVKFIFKELLLIYDKFVMVVLNEMPVFCNLVSNEGLSRHFFPCSALLRDFFCHFDFLLGIY